MLDELRLVRAGRDVRDVSRSSMGVLCALPNSEAARVRVDMVGVDAVLGSVLSSLIERASSASTRLLDDANSTLSKNDSKS